MVGIESVELTNKKYLWLAIVLIVVVLVVSSFHLYLDWPRDETPRVQRVIDEAGAVCWVTSQGGIDCELVVLPTPEAKVP